MPASETKKGTCVASSFGHAWHHLLVFKLAGVRSVLAWLRFVLAWLHSAMTDFILRCLACLISLAFWLPFCCFARLSWVPPFSIGQAHEIFVGAACPPDMFSMSRGSYMICDAVFRGVELTLCLPPRSLAFRLVTPTSEAIPSTPEGLHTSHNPPHPTPP